MTAVLFSVLMVTSVFAGTVALGVGTDVAGAAPGDVLYRANAGGSFTADGNQWDPLETYQVAGQDETSSHGQPSTIHSSVPSGTPTQIWETERWDPSSSPEMQYEFSVPSGQQVEVRLYFYDGYSGTSSVGDRVFDVAIEGQTVLDDFDIIETYGDDTGAMESFTVTSDGTIDVDFGHVTENPQVNAIEIVESGPQPGELGGPDSVDFGTVLTDNSKTETVTVTNLGESGDTDITVSDVSITGGDASEFSHDFSGSTTLAPGDSLDVQVTFSPSDAQAKGATLEFTHDAPNTASPLTVDLTGEGASDIPVGFSKSKLQGFSAGNPTAIDFGPDGRAYVSTQGGTVYALDVERTGDDSYQVVNEVQIDAITDIPNHDDLGNIESGETNRQITGLTAAGTASQPIVYVSSSDPEIDVGQDDDDTDTNSGAISRLTIDPGSDGVLQASEVDHDVMVLGLPRSEENHATNGLDLSPDGTTLYVAQGGHTNKGAPGDNFGHTPEYALSAAVLEIDLAQIENNYQAKNLNNYDSNYPNLDFYYAIPTIQNDDATDGDDLPFGGNDGINQAKLIEGGPVGIFSPGYRNPYDLVLAESGQLYVSDHGPNGGWGGQPVDASGNIVADAASVTNHPNEDGSFSTNDQLIAADEGEYGGHAAPIRANPTGADIYDANGNVEFDITSSNSPVPSSMVNPVEADYIPPTGGSPDPGAPAGSANTMETTGGQKVLFAPTGGTEEYTASNFGGAMEGDILQVELGGDIERVELSADGQTATNVETLFNTGGPLGIAAQDDDEVFPGTIWTANHGGNDITVFEPDDFDGTGGGDDCTGADDATLDEDGDGYDNADEIDAGTDPCSSSSTPADFDDDGTSNLNDDDDDNDGQLDDVDPFAVDADDGTTTTLPVQHDLSELSLFGEDGQGWTGLMTNGQDDYQDLYDPTKMTVGGAAEVLTVEEVPQGDAHAGGNGQMYAFQFGVNPPDEPFVIESTVASFPENPENFQSAGIQIGTGDQSNYAKLVVAADGGSGGIEFAQEEGDSFTHQTSPNVVSDSAVTGSDTTLRLIVDPTTDPMPNNGDSEVALTAEYEVGGTTSTVGTAAVPAEWLDTSDGSGLAVGVIATSNGASSTFPATWTDISVTPVDSPPTVDAIADQTVTEGESATVSVSASDPDGDSLTLSKTSGPAFVTLTDNGDGTGTLDIAPQDGDAGTYTVEVEASDGSKTATESFQVTVDEPLAAGEVLYRINNGGPEIAATDSGPAWAADTGNQPSQYLVGGDTQTVNWASSGFGDAALDGGVDASVPSSTPTEVFTYERYDPPSDGEMQWEFPVQSGTEVEVRLYFADQCSCTGPNSDPLRIFDVSSEGQTVLDDYHISEEFGDDTAGMASFTVTSDGTVDVDFAHVSENPVVNAIEIVKVSDAGDMTVEEAVASQNAPEDQIDLQEIQTAINWWATGSEVPGTGGETIGLQEIQQLINAWATGATVGDGGPTASFTVTPQSPLVGEEVTLDASGSTGDGLSYSWMIDGQHNHEWHGPTVTHTFDTAGDHEVTLTVTDSGGDTDQATKTVTVGEALTGSALVEITPDSGVDTSTYGSGSYQVTNTGEKEIASVSFDLSTASLPDMVFDPQGTAGDPTGEGLNIVDEGGTGITTQPGTGEAFSQPHNGQDGDDGYDVMTVEFDDFQSGETATFWADNDPTSIKGATVGSQEAGPVSGLELARSTVTVTYADGTTQTTQLMGDGSDGGATAVVNSDEAPAPSIGAQGVSLDSSALDARHGAATVSSASQTIAVTGEPGETVTLVRVEGELTLTNVPDADNDGEPGYEIEDYEANNAEDVEYYAVTLDSNGEGTVPVTLTNTDTDGDDNAGLNYFVAAQGQASGDMGLASNVVVLEYEPDAGGTSNVLYRVNAGGPQLSAVDSGPDWEAGDGTYVVAGGDSTDSWGSATLDSSVPQSTPPALFETERWDGTSGEEMQYEFSVPDGQEVEVRLYFRNGWDGTSQPGERVFDVSVEGDLVLDDYDIAADVGHDTGTMKSFVVTSDGTIDIDFAHAGANNPLINGIEIVETDGTGDTNTAPTADAGADQTVDEGTTVTLDASGSSDTDGSIASYAWTQTGGPSVSLSDTSAAQPTFTAPDVSGDQTLTFEVEVTDDDGATATDTVSVTVQDTDTANTAPTIESITDQGVSQSGSATASVSASDADSGDSLSLSVGSGPSWVTIDDNGDGTGTVNIDPGTSVSVGTYTVEVTVTDGQASATEAFAVYVDEPDQDGQVVAAINVGGDQFTAGDGTVYEADSTNQYYTGGTAFSTGSAGTPSDPDIANTQDDTLYQTERYGGSFSYNIPVSESGTYEVTLQFAEIYQGVSTNDAPDSDGPTDGTNENDRLFDVSVEGQQVISSYDIFSEVGPLAASDKTYTVEVTDGTLNVDFSVVNDNAKISAIKVEKIDGGSAGTTSADVTVNSGTSNIDASTFNGGSFEVTNTGDEPISSVEIDLSESAIPDAVFDPQGTAGDDGAKGLEIDSESGDGVGVVSTADGDVFGQPHNGQDGSDGYDAMTIEFDDFDAGETVAFSVDIDPTAIKGASTTGGAGSVSGLELSGSAVTVESASATVSNDLFADGSQGGSQAAVSADASAAPSLGVQGVTLGSTDFPAHQAATVSDQQQTLALSGPAGATVELLTIEASAPPSDGYDVDAFEADNAEAVSTQTVTLDSNGQATVQVSLSESNLNYFQAAVQDGSGATGMVSRTVVLEVETSTNTAPSIDAISDQTVVTGETVTVPVSASDAEGDSLTLSKSSGPAFVALTDNGDGTGSLEVAPASGDAGTYTVEVTADDGTDQTTESFQLTVETATSVTSGTALHRVNVGESTTLSATDGGPDWTGVVDTSSQYLDSVGQSNAGNYCNGDPVTPSSSVPSSTPAEVYDCERYGLSTWTFDVTQGSEVEVRLYLSNQFPQATTDGDRQYNVDIEGDQVLTQYDPVQDVGHATGTVKAFTVTENGDGTVTITFDPGPVENPQVNAIEIVETSSGGG